VFSFVKNLFISKDVGVKKVGYRYRNIWWSRNQYSFQRCHWQSIYYYVNIVTQMLIIAQETKSYLSFL